MTATETPLPSSDEPSVPASVRTASAPRVAVFEVSCVKAMGVLPSRYVTPGWVRAASICPAVPEATTTPIVSNSVIVRMPLASTAARAAAMSVPCTISVVLPVRSASCPARNSWTEASESDGAACAGEMASAPATRAAPLTTPRIRRDDRRMVLLGVGERGALSQRARARGVTDRLCPPTHVQDEGVHRPDLPVPAR